MPKTHKLEPLFNPQSVAVIGASAKPQAWGGTTFIKQLLQIGFPGAIHPINRKAESVLGLTAYPDLASIPHPVDYAIVAVSAPGVPGALEDCIAAGIKNVHIFSSGFSETGEEEGQQLEEQIAGIIERGKLRAIGPNCFGPWVPGSRFAGWGAEPKGTGSLAFISQSGGHGEFLTRYAQDLGVYFSKVVSFGNARGLQAVDFLEYLAQDPDTRVIAVYLEDTKDGGRLTQTVREINRAKPVIVWKAGLTASGSRAAAYHTGSRPGESRIWDGFFAQTGAIRVASLEEILDAALPFLYLPEPRGRRTLLISAGGGRSVAFADICGSRGLEVSPISDKTRRELNSFIQLAGNSTWNPLDIWGTQYDTAAFRRAMALSVGDPGIDLVVIDRMMADPGDDGTGDDLEAGKTLTPNQVRQREVDDLIIDFAGNNPDRKPLVVAINIHGGDLHHATFAVNQRRKLIMTGIPAYTQPAHAAGALARYVRYHEHQKRR